MADFFTRVALRTLGSLPPAQTIPMPSVAAAIDRMAEPISDMEDHSGTPGEPGETQEMNAADRSATPPAPARETHAPESPSPAASVPAASVPVAIPVDAPQPAPARADFPLVEQASAPAAESVRRADAP